MRWVILIVAISLLVSGCNADPRCRRETALLRAEILDLEDKNALLQHQRDAAYSEMDALVGDPVCLTDERLRTIRNQRKKLDSAANVVGSGQTVYLSDSAAEMDYSDGEIIYEPYEEAAPGQFWDDQRIVEPVPADMETILPQEIESEVPLQDDVSDPVDGNPTTRSRIMLNGPQTVSTKGPLRSTRSPAKNLTAEKIRIDTQRSGGKNLDGNPGDEGIELWLQVQSADGQPLRPTGALTISVLDPSVTSVNQRIGLWKFVAEETELFFVSSGDQAPAIQLQLPWETAVPRGRQVAVFVRLTAEDGQVLESSANLAIEPPSHLQKDQGDLIADWVKRGEINSSQAQATKVSTGDSRIQKPAWRPVR